MSSFIFLILHIASINQTKNSGGFSELGKTKQLLITIVVAIYFSQFHIFYPYNYLFR